MKDLDRNKVYSLEGLTGEQTVELLSHLRWVDSGWKNQYVGLIESNKYLRYDSGWCVGSQINVVCTTSILTLFEPDPPLVESIKQLVEKISDLRFNGEDSVGAPVPPKHVGFVFDIKSNKSLYKVRYLERINFDDTSWCLVLKGNSASFDGGLGLLTTLDADRDKVLANVKETLESALLELEKMAVKPTKESRLDEYLAQAGYEQGEERERMKKLIMEYNDFNPDLK